MESKDIEDKRKLAFELWKVHQTIISRKEHFAIVMRGWLYTLITTLLVAQMTLNVHLLPFYLGLILFSNVFVVLCMEISNRTPSQLSQMNVEKIISFLNGETDKFPTSIQYSKKEIFKAHWHLLTSGRILFPYLLLILIIILFLICY